VAIARAIWTQTTVRQGWLAERLGMKSAANVSQLIRGANRGQTPTELPRELRQWVNRVSKKCCLTLFVLSRFIAVRSIPSNSEVIDP
jgi:hypothetical protein